MSLIDDKTMATANQYRSDGDTIPYLATAQDVTDSVGIGDIVELQTAIQRIGIVQTIRDAGSMEHKKRVTGVGDNCDVRVCGMIAASKMEAADWPAGTLMEFLTATPRSDSAFSKNQDGGHVLVEAFSNTNSDKYGVIQMNVNPVVRNAIP